MLQGPGDNYLTFHSLTDALSNPIYRQTLKRCHSPMYLYDGVSVWGKKQTKRTPIKTKKSQTKQKPNSVGSLITPKDA